MPKEIIADKTAPTYSKFCVWELSLYENSADFINIK